MGERNSRGFTIQTNPRNWESFNNAGYEHVLQSSSLSFICWAFLRKKRALSCGLPPFAPRNSAHTASKQLRPPEELGAPLAGFVIPFMSRRSWKQGGKEAPGIWWPLLGLICFVSPGDKSANIIWSHFCLLAPYWMSEITWIEFSQVCLDWWYSFQTVTTSYFSQLFSWKERPTTGYPSR